MKLPQVRYSNRPVVIGRHDTAEVLMIKFPQAYNASVDEVTNMNQYGGGFDFLENELDLYSLQRCQKVLQKEVDKKLRLVLGLQLASLISRKGNPAHSFKKKISGEEGMIVSYRLENH